MEVTNILRVIGIEHVSSEQPLEFASLGLVRYNQGEKVCTFIEDEKYVKDLTPNISVVLMTLEIGEKLKKADVEFGICIVENPRLAYFMMHNYLSELDTYKGVSYSTKIGKNCRISDSAVISPQNVFIGNNVSIEEFVVIRENTVIGDNSIIRAGCKIGGEGFEFKKKDESIFGVKHVGSVVIGKNVEVQYNTCIDKAIYPWDKTILEDFVKIDNLVHIGHAVKIGKRSMIVANSGIGGRVTIGKDSWIGFGSTIRNGIVIGDNARVNMGAVVTKDMKNFEKVSGNFAIPHEAFIKEMQKRAGECSKMLRDGLTSSECDRSYRKAHNGLVGNNGGKR